MERPNVGIGVFVLNKGKVLLHKRKGAHGEGSWSFPGGHLEHNESFFNAATREVKEEFGLSVKNPRFICITNGIFKKENKHYVTIYIATDYVSGKAKILEKNKCTDVGWFELDNFPKPLFVPLKNLLNNKCFPENWRDRLLGS